MQKKVLRANKSKFKFLRPPPPLKRSPFPPPTRPRPPQTRALVIAPAPRSWLPPSPPLSSSQPRLTSTQNFSNFHTSFAMPYLPLFAVVVLDRRLAAEKADDRRGSLQ